MKVKLYNDGKEKWESYRADIDDSDIDFEINPFVGAYGATKEEAIAGLKNKINKLIELLNNINFNNIEKVAFNGQELHEYLRELEG